MPTRRTVLVEACVTSLEEAVRCETAGADRLELCVDLDVGGLTPPARLVASVREAVAIPVFAMVRPRSGSFTYDAREVERMESTTRTVLDAGADGIVTGALDSELRVDAGTMVRLVAAADGKPVTFHRAFDEIEDLPAAMDDLAGAGVTRVLTSGGSPTAMDGAAMLEQLVRASRARVVVLAGGRVRADHAVRLVERAGVSELHARAEAVPELVRALRGD